jgi:hypothetical protein
VKVLLRQRRKLQQPGVQALQLALGHRVEVYTTDTLIGTRPLQPTQKNLGSAGIRNGAFAQATLNLGVTRWLTVTPGCTAFALRSPCPDGRGGLNAYRPKDARPRPRALTAATGGGGFSHDECVSVLSPVNCRGRR